MGTGYLDTPASLCKPIADAVLDIWKFEHPRSSTWNVYNVCRFYCRAHNMTCTLLNLMTKVVGEEHRKTVSTTKLSIHHFDRAKCNANKLLKKCQMRTRCTSNWIPSTPKVFEHHSQRNGTNVLAHTNRHMPSAGTTPARLRLAISSQPPPPHMFHLRFDDICPINCVIANPLHMFHCSAVTPAK